MDGYKYIDMHSFHHSISLMVFEPSFHVLPTQVNARLHRLLAAVWLWYHMKARLQSMGSTAKVSVMVVSILIKEYDKYPTYIYIYVYLKIFGSSIFSPILARVNWWWVLVLMPCTSDLALSMLAISLPCRKSTYCSCSSSERCAPGHCRGWYVWP